MLERGTRALHDAWAGGWALAAFSIYDLAQARAIHDAAEAEAAPVILQAGSSAFRGAGRVPLAALALAVAREGPARIGVHLDHAIDLDDIRACLHAGYSSVMYDGSALDFDDNVRVTRQVVADAHAAGAWVEAELVGFGGDEDRSVAGAGRAGMTDPDDAARFVERTGVDALAVAIGNVHGIIAEPVRLDLERLARIAERVEVPLVLHGASGLPDDDVRAAIALGVAKINVNTELRRAYLAAARQMLEEHDGDDLAGMLGSVRAAVGRVAREKISIYGGLGRAAVVGRRVA